MARLSSPLPARLGPFTITYEPDGDDPNTGLIRLETASGYSSETPLGVPRSEFNRFLMALAARRRCT